MSDSQTNPPFEEQAALHAMDLLNETERRELLAAAHRDEAVDGLVRDFTETAAQLAHEAPGVVPPPELRRRIMQQLPARRAGAVILPFVQWIPYAIAACLMILGISQAKQILNLKAQLQANRTEINRLAESNALIGLRLATLEAKDVSYSASKIMVAWDPQQHRGVVAMQNLPIPPAGHDYQLWVLDPGAQAPLSAGLITASRAFAVQSVSTASPGFAISLEPSGGRPEPTGPILFAVAPGA